MAVVLFKGLRARLEEKIVESIESLRECCGAFGYHYFSGMPSILERVQHRVGMNFTSKKDLIEVTLTYLGKQTVAFLDETHALFDIDVRKQTQVCKVDSLLSPPPHPADREVPRPLLHTSDERRRT